MPNPPKKIIPNANNCASFNEIKHRQNYCRIRTGAFTYAMVHLVSRATLTIIPWFSLEFRVPPLTPNP